MSDKTDLGFPLLDLNSSLNILIQGVQIAQKAGLYNFQDSASIYQAIHSIQALAKKQAPKDNHATHVATQYPNLNQITQKKEQPDTKII